jgi:hypothetical protein
VLTLARAFQLMTDALAEFRGPVGQNPLRLRMVAMHGREDPLLDAARFPRLLRQANDAEVADVRQVGDDEYEVTGRRRPDGRAAAAAPAAPAAAAPAVAPVEAVSPNGATASTAGAEAAAVPAAAARDSGPRRGVRFRRGSRGPMRAGEIPLVGVVRQETPAAVAVAPPQAEPPAKPPVKEKAPRQPRAKAARKAPDAAKAAKRPSRAKAAKKPE